MAGPEVHHLFHHPIADHSFSSDRHTLAVARDNNVELYNRSGNGFTLKDELKGHDKTVTGVDIAPSSGMIVTCSQGRRHKPFSPNLVFSLSIFRPQRLRLGAVANGVETYPGSSSNQSGSNFCSMVTLREEIRGRFRSKSYCGLLF